jgi:dihydrofolate synthase / folylpolyglutamate synthase
VTAMVERGLRAAGHTTGRYTSPHLSRVEERIAINGEPIDSAAFDRVAADVLAAVEALRASEGLASWPTFFEVTTAMAFELFRRHHVDTAVVEVGLGGRFDATNVLRPTVTAITSIALDHERHLGSTLSEITAEKAGIIKPSVPVVVGELVPEAHAVVAAQAARVDAPIIPAGVECVRRLSLARGRATIDLATPAADYGEITLGLNGAHQVANAVVAARTLEICGERGIPTTPPDIVTALSGVEWPARLEWLRLGADRFVLLDAAHNPAGAAALADYVRAAGVAPLPLVLAAMRDKDIERIVRAVAPVVSMFLPTQLASARCLTSSELAARVAAACPSAAIRPCDDPERALDNALESHHRAAVAGSIFLVGPMRERLLERGGVPADVPH